MNSLQSTEMLKIFRDITNDMYETAVKKNADYSWDVAFKNFELVEVLGITDVATWLLVRQSDKVSRITNLLQRKFQGVANQVKDESITDSLVDLANYCILLKIYLDTLE